MKQNKYVTVPQKNNISGPRKKIISRPYENWSEIMDDSDLIEYLYIK